MEERLAHVEKEIEALKERNKRVEADKAWETSWLRILTVAGVTYGVAVALLYLVRAEHVFLGALVPAVGFILSTQTLPALKRWWITRSLSR